MHVIGASLQMCWFTELKIIVNLSQSVTKKKGKQPFTNVLFLTAPSRSPRIGGDLE